MSPLVKQHEQQKAAKLFSHMVWTDILLHVAQYHVCSLRDVYCVWNQVSRDLFVRIHRFTFEQDRTDLSIERLFGNICKVNFRMPGQPRRRISEAEKPRSDLFSPITAINTTNTINSMMMMNDTAATAMGGEFVVVEKAKLPLSNSRANLVHEQDVFHFFLKYHFFKRTIAFKTDERPVSVYNRSYYCTIREIDFMFEIKNEDLEKTFLTFFSLPPSPSPKSSSSSSNSLLSPSKSQELQEEFQELKLKETKEKAEEKVEEEDEDTSSIISLYDEVLFSVHFQVFSDYSLGNLQRADFSTLVLTMQEREDDAQSPKIIQRLPFHSSEFSVFDLSRTIRGQLNYQLSGVNDLIRYLSRPNCVELSFQYGESGYSQVVVFRNDEETMKKLSLRLMLGLTTK